MSDAKLQTRPQTLPPLGHALSGAGSSALALFLIYPLDTLKTRLQTHPTHKTAHQTLQHILSTQGIQGLYSGLSTNLLNQLLNGFVYFYAYSAVRKLALKSSAQVGGLSTAVELSVGAVAGMINQVLTLPLGVVATRQQAGSAEWWRVVKEIIDEEGVSGLWAGFKPAMLLCANPAITYGVFEKTKEALVRRRQSGGVGGMSAMEAFWVGALAKTLATILTYPYIMAKVRLQWRPSKEEREAGARPYLSAGDVLRQVLRKEGVWGWFRGMQTQIIKAVITQALMLMIKESFTRQVARAFALAR
ncbi:hypothetical protein LPJ66_005561 [Kickxella alabastrina]|uniref:Uncharacterized protein n=1 Tax=Kickxella alabastrina TaxID=61397 RepID=A0ACC1II45_9FUNG|nr:hypothetical protein LPJ66_005561 [Kickxella alabastrina]